MNSFLKSISFRLLGTRVPSLEKDYPIRRLKTSEQKNEVEDKKTQAIRETLADYTKLYDKANQCNPYEIKVFQFMYKHIQDLIQTLPSGSPKTTLLQKLNEAKSLIRQNSSRFEYSTNSRKCGKGIPEIGIGVGGGLFASLSEHLRFNKSEEDTDERITDTDDYDPSKVNEEANQEFDSKEGDEQTIKTADNELVSFPQEEQTQSLILENPEKKAPIINHKESILLQPQTFENVPLLNSAIKSTALFILSIAALRIIQG